MSFKTPFRCFESFDIPGTFTNEDMLAERLITFLSSAQSSYYLKIVTLNEYCLECLL